KECHAVLLLSSVTQFLNAADSDLIVRKLEDAGVSKGYIIGTMMDIGVREYDKKSGSFQRDYMASKKVYTTRASEVFAKLAKDGNIISIEKNPEFVSSFLFAIARKRERGTPLNEAEEDLIYWCKKMFPKDADEVFRGSEGCDVFSGFSSVLKNIIAPIKAQREEIIAAKIVKFEAATRAMFLRRLEDAVIDAENRLNQIRNSDKNSLKERYDACRACLKSSRYDVNAIFDEVATNAARTINRLKVDIHNLMPEHKHLNITTEIDTHVKSEGWIFKDYYYETTRTRRASAAQASGNIDSFAGEAERLVENELADLIDVETISGRVKRAIEGAFDAMGRKSGSEITGPLNSVLNGLTVRKIDFTKAREAKQAIYDKFSTDVTDSDIARLERVQDEQLHEVLASIERELDDVEANIRNMMNTKAGTFIDDVERVLDDSMKEIESQLNDRENNIKRYEAFINAINGLKQELQR
ncbi:MAG: hypothetical protein IJU31_05245, partial [Synergistaceae bacterium]|nr:hypothetical protein [Synergistaceae bacterium]